MHNTGRREKLRCDDHGSNVVGKMGGCFGETDASGRVESSSSVPP